MKSLQWLLVLWGVGLSSSAVHARGVLLFEECDYRGREARFAVRDTYYSLGELEAAGLPNDSASAVHVPAGFQVTLYEHEGTEGRSWVLTEGVSCLSSIGADELVSSLVVERLPGSPAREEPLDAAPTLVNLLVNPDASTGDMTGWTILENGGEGWHVEQGVFRTSYNWSRRVQTVDLYASGYDASIMAEAPPIFVSEQFMRRYCPDHYYLKVELLDEQQQVVTSWNSLPQKNSGVCQWGGEVWDELSYVFEHYGPGVRYVRWEDGGKDSEHWGGLYGPALDNAVLAVRYPAVVPNLLVNGDASYGNLDGWVVMWSGGEGWAVGPGGLDGSPAFRTSFVWTRRYQEVDLLARGYTAAVLDRAPPVVVSEWFRRQYCPDWYSLKVSLLDASRQVLASWDSGEHQTSGECAWGGESWNQLFHTFKGYGPGVRYIRFEDGGRDSESWGGHYGTWLDDAFLAVHAPLTPASQAKRSASLDGGACGGLNEPPVWRCTEHFAWPPWQWGECRVTSPICCEGLMSSYFANACVPKAGSCATQVPGGFSALDEETCTTTLTGHLMWSNAKPIANATVSIIDSNGKTLKEKGASDEHGNFSITLDSAIDFSAPVYSIQVQLQGTVASIRHPGCLSSDAYVGFVFSPKSFTRRATRRGDDVQVSLGTLQHSPDSQRLPVDSAWASQIWTAVHDAAAFVRVHGGFEMQQVAICESSSVSGLSYDPLRNTIRFRPTLDHLPADVVLHEYGHKVMHEAYGPYDYRDGRCAVGHAPRVSIDTQCAWIEGWATFFSLAVRNSSVFGYPSGASFDFGAYQSSVQNGTDEGRVAAALWGLYDRGDGAATSRVSAHHFISAMRQLRNNGACGGDCEGLQGYYRVLRQQLSRGQKLAGNGVMRGQYIFPQGYTFPEERDEL